MFQEILTICYHNLIATFHSLSDRTSVIANGVILIMVIIGLYRSGSFFYKRLTATRHLVSLVRFGSTRVDISSLTNDDSDCGQINLIPDSHGPMAFTLGFVNPGIYLSLSLVNNLSPTALDIVIEHEKGHASRHDPLRHTLLKAASEFLWFVPIFREWLNRSRLNSEVYCDSLSLSKGHNATDIAKVLVEVASINNRIDNHVVPAISSFDDEIEFRIKALIGAGPKKQGKLDRRIVAVSLAFALLISISLGSGFIHIVDPVGIHTSLNNLASACDMEHAQESCFEIVGIQGTFCSS